jgi:hypothetical protein
MLYYIQTHSKDTIRGGSELKSSASTMEGKEGLDLEYATAWSYGKGETFNLLIPNLYGGSSEGGFSEDGEVAQALSKYGARNTATPTGLQPLHAKPSSCWEASAWKSAAASWICPRALQASPKKKALPPTSKPS